MSGAGSSAARIVLAGTFAAAAALKCAGLGRAPAEGILLASPALVVAVSAIELLLASALFTRFRVWALHGCMAVAVVGVWAVVLTRTAGPVKRGCGCLGRVPLSDAEHALLALCVFVLAWIALREANKTRPRRVERATERPS